MSPKTEPVTPPPPQQMVLRLGVSSFPKHFLLRVNPCVTRSHPSLLRSSRRKRRGSIPVREVWNLGLLPNPRYALLLRSFSPNLFFFLPLLLSPLLLLPFSFFSSFFSSSSSSFVLTFDSRNFYYHVLRLTWSLSLLTTPSVRFN